LIERAEEADTRYSRHGIRWKAEIVNHKVNPRRNDLRMTDHVSTTGRRCWSMPAGGVCRLRSCSTLSSITARRFGDSVGRAMRHCRHICALHFEACSSSLEDLGDVPQNDGDCICGQGNHVARLRILEVQPHAPSGATTVGSGAMLGPVLCSEHQKSGASDTPPPAAATVDSIMKYLGEGLYIYQSTNICSEF
jgi:hypothetical protein